MCAVSRTVPGSAICSMRAAEADGVALRRVVHAQIVADAADHHLSRVEPHAHREAEAVREAQLVGVAAQVARAAPARRGRRARVILVRDRRAEERHDRRRRCTG